MASLIKRARASHAHASPLLRAQRTSAHRGDTEAPRMPCCANNTTAHVRDISFYYYPSVRSLPFPLPPAPTNPSTVLLAPSLPRPFLLFLESSLLLFFLSLSFSLYSSFHPVPTLFLLPPALLLFLLFSLSFCSATARVSRCHTVCISCKEVTMLLQQSRRSPSIVRRYVDWIFCNFENCSIRHQRARCTID